MYSHDHSKSFISGKELTVKDRVSYKEIRHSILDFLHQDHPDFDANSFISLSELNEYRERYIASFLSKEVEELSDLENEVIQSIVAKTSLTSSSDEDMPIATFGQRIADKVATFCGSWRFILLFSAFTFIWICINILWLANKGYDPYPFILLNLILSCIASMQAPVTMMSQNRQDQRDRARGEKDYQINLKSELEIRTLHEKIDHLIIHQ